MNVVWAYLISLGYFLIFDYFWLAHIAKNLYSKNIGHLMADKPNLLAAGVFYLIFLVGLNYFVINPNIENSVWKLLLSAVIFGFVTYSTFDLTSQAVFKNWPTFVSVIDIIWGILLSSGVSVLTYYTFKAIF